MDYCDSCAYRKIETAAEKYCKSCQERQCKACSEVHSSGKATRNHLIVPIAQLKKESVIGKDLESFQKCSIHCDKELDFFCIDHSHLICSSCLLTKPEHGCKTFADIHSVGKQITEKAFDKQLMADLENIQAECKEDEKEISILVQTCNANREELAQFMKSTRQKFLTIFNKYEETLMGEINSRVDMDIEKLMNQKVKTAHTLELASDGIEMLQTITTAGSKADLFRCALSLTKQLENLKIEQSKLCINVNQHMLKLSPALTAVLMDFVPALECESVQSAILSTTIPKLITGTANLLDITKQTTMPCESACASSSVSLPSDESITIDTSKVVKSINRPDDDTSAFPVNNMTTPSPDVNLIDRVGYQITPVGVISLQLANGECPLIKAAITLRNGSIVLSDSKHSRLVILDKNLVYKTAVDLPQKPGNMAVLNEKYLFVCIQQKRRVAVVSTVQEMKWVRNFITAHEPKGIAALNGDRLIVSMTDASGVWYIRILSSEGHIIRHVAESRSLRSGYHISAFKMSCRPLCILQCCSTADRLFCFDVDGNDIFKYSLKSPNAICVDTAGFIYVADSEGILHVLSYTGQLLQKIPIPSSANSIAVCLQMKRVIITQRSEPNINVFQILR